MAATLSNARPMRTIRRSPAWLAALPLLGLLWSAFPATAGELEPVSGSPAADALGNRDLAGRAHRLDDYVGKVVLVNFWATWCPPCVAEMPSLQRLYTAFSDQPFALLAVSMGEGERKIQQFKKTAGVDFPLLLDKTSDLSQRWGVDFLPTSYLIDAQGRARYKAYGEVDWDDEAVRATLRALLEEADAGPTSTD
jgi:thiol-disulfide isomerase/thioredoxin